MILLNREISMKKLLALVLACLILPMTLVSSTPTDSNEVTGTDMAKLLLASQRLDARLLRKDGDIFDSGTNAFNTLAVKANENFKRRSYTTTKEIINPSTVISGDYIGKLNVDNDAFTWSDFDETINSYEYFQ